MGTYYTPFNHTKKQFIDWINRTRLSDKDWVFEKNGMFLAYLLQWAWQGDNVILEPDDNWEDYENYEDVTESTINDYNQFVEPTYRIELLIKEKV